MWFFLLFQHVNGDNMLSPFQLKATQAGSSYAPNIISDNASSSHQCPINLDAVTDCLTNENSPSYCFVRDNSAMQRLMLAHGLHVNDLDRSEWGHSLCYHILRGLCADMPADNKLKRSACDNISGSFSSARQLELLILDLFIDKLAPDMPLKLFRRLCASIDIPEHTFLPQKQLVLRLQTRRHNLQNMISNSSPLGILHDFDHM
jgi:hypothetical protein